MDWRDAGGTDRGCCQVGTVRIGGRVAVGTTAVRLERWWRVARIRIGARRHQQGCRWYK